MWLNDYEKRFFPQFFKAKIQLILFMLLVIYIYLSVFIQFYYLVSSIWVKTFFFILILFAILFRYLQSSFKQLHNSIFPEIFIFFAIFHVTE